MHPRDTAATAPASRHDHLCWVYADPADFRRRSIEFLAAGAAAGYRVELLGNASPDQLHADFAPLDGYRTLLRDHQLVVRSLSDQYGVDEVVEPHEPVEAYAAATRDAVAAGYTGLCVVADATALVRTALQRAAFARYEHLVDHSMTQQPFTAMCAYDAAAIGPKAAAEIACLHPSTSPAATAFQWHAARAADLRLAGEIDVATQPAFTTRLGRTMPLLAGRRLTVDGNELSFIDHRGLLTLDEHAQGASTRLLLGTKAPLAQQLAALLQLEAVTVEAAL